MAYRRLFRKKRFGPKRKPRRAVRGKKGTGYRSRSFKTAVKRVIHRMAENKTWTQVATNVALPAPIIGSTSATSVQPWSLNLMPNLQQGTGSTGRIGNRIRIVKNRIKGYVNLRPIATSINTYQAPILLKLFVFSPKNFTNFTGDMGFANWQQFFRVNNADTGFTGTPLDMCYSINDELYTLHTTRTIQLSAVPWFQTPTIAVAYQGGTGKFSVPFNINLSKYVKDCKYDDNTSARVTNKNLIICAFCCYADGTTNGYVTPYDLAEIHYVQDVEYEDL